MLSACRQSSLYAPMVIIHYILLDLFQAQHKVISANKDLSTILQLTPSGKIEFNPFMLIEQKFRMLHIVDQFVQFFFNLLSLISSAFDCQQSGEVFQLPAIISHQETIAKSGFLLEVLVKLSVMGGDLMSVLDHWFEQTTHKIYRVFQHFFLGEMRRKCLSFALVRKSIKFDIWKRLGFQNPILIDNQHKPITRIHILQIFLADSHDKRHKILISRLYQMRGKVMYKHMLPFERSHYLQQTLDDHHIEITTATGNYKLLLKQDSCYCNFDCLIGERQIKEMTKLKHRQLFELVHMQYWHIFLLLQDDGVSTSVSITFGEVVLQNHVDACTFVLNSVGLQTAFLALQLQTLILQQEVFIGCMSYVGTAFSNLTKNFKKIDLHLEVWLFRHENEPCRQVELLVLPPHSYQLLIIKSQTFFDQTFFLNRIFLTQYT